MSPPPPEDIPALARRLRADADSPRAAAVAIYRFVRDEIRFGFTPLFDQATPTQTLQRRQGHCNPQGALLVALLRAADVEARQHFVTLHRTLLDGLFPRGGEPPAAILHSLVEVRLDGRWLPIDGHILDPRFFAAAQQRLRSEGRTLGYGTHIDARIDWDGTTPCMAQFVDPDMRVADHGAPPRPEALYASADNPQRLDRLGGAVFRWFAAPGANTVIDAMRDSLP